MRRLWFLLLAGFTLFIATLIYLANSGQGGRLFSMFQWIPWYDKIGHFFLMGTLGFLSVAALSPRLPWRRAISSWTIMGVVLLAIGLEEWSQQFVPAREYSLFDFLFGAAGVLVLGLLADRWIARNSSDAPGPES